MQRRKHTWRMAVQLITFLLFIDWFGRCALEKNFTTKEHLLSLLWQYSPPRKQWRHLIQHMIEAESQTPKSMNSELPFNSEPDHDVSSSMPPVSLLQSSLKITASSNVPLETSPLSSPEPSLAHSPSGRLSVPAPPSKFPLPSILPPLPNLHKRTRSIGQPSQHFQPPAHSIPKTPQERHRQIPTLSPAPAPTASSPNVHKSTGGPISHWPRHRNAKSSPVCVAVPCAAPYTQSPLGSPCGCVLPIQVGIELSVALYALFPSISVLAEEIANGTLLLQSQVRVIGANADSEDQGKSMAEVNLVPLNQAFDKLTAILIFQRFWNHEVAINESVFGQYTVMYFRYPGLPPSPPSAYPHDTTMGGLPGTLAGRPVEQPLSVDVNKKGENIDSATIAVIALSSTVAFAASLGVFWALFLRCSRRNITSVPKGSGIAILSLSPVSPVASNCIKQIHGIAIKKCSSC